MGSTWKLIRVAKLGVRHAAVFLLVLAMGWMPAAQLLVSTPTGVHCPMAPTQAISKNIVCCGKVVAVEVHKPRLGEKGFVQCRCAEKKSAQHQATLSSGQPHFDLLPPDSVMPAIPERIPDTFFGSSPVVRLVAVATIPFVPPPSLI